MYHISGCWTLSPNNHPLWWGFIHDLIYSFHMPLFMFASGYIYITTNKNQSYKDFVVKKIRRLMIPYFVVSIIVISIKILTDKYMYVENPKTILSFIKIFYYPEAGYFLWFIWALWWMFVIVPLFKNKKIRLLLFFISIIFAYIPISLTDIFCINEFKRMMVYFLFGVVVFDWKNYLSLFNRIPSYIYCTLFLTLFVLRYYAVGEGLINILYKCIPFIGIVSILSLSRRIDKSNYCPQWLMQISASSYIIYLFHTTFEGFTKSLVHKTPFLNDISNHFIFTIGAIIVISSGVILPIILNEKVLKKYNLTKILFGLK